MEITSLVVSVLALVFAGGAVWYARGQKLAASASAREAKRSADAAVEAVGYQRREVERSRVVFVLEPSGGAAHLLTHQGTDDAYAVDVEVGDMYVDGEVYDFEVFRAGQTEPIYLSPGMAPGMRHVMVSWHQLPDLSDERSTTYLYVGR
jgi:hypothetical protein